MVLFLPGGDPSALRGGYRQAPEPRKVAVHQVWEGNRGVPRAVTDDKPMILSHLSLTNFRNYRSLEWSPPPCKVVVHGGNAQGKTNLLEAIYLVATTRSHRATAERELIHWQALREDALPVARLEAQVQRAQGPLAVEIALKAEPRPLLGEGAPGEDRGGPALHVQKRIRVNGLVRRAADVVGQV